MKTDPNYYRHCYSDSLIAVCSFTTLFCFYKKGQDKDCNVISVFYRIV